MPTPQNSTNGHSPIPWATWYIYMSKDIENFIRKTCSCVVSKKMSKMEKTPLVQIEATYPFQIASIDFLHLDQCKGGYEYVLAVCNHWISLDLPNPVKQLQKNYLINLTSIYFVICTKLQELDDLTRLHTT